MRKDYRTWIFSFVAILFSVCPEGSLSQSRRIDPEVQKKIDDFIQDSYLPLSQISGMGLTIVQNNGEVLYTTGYGLADREKGIPNGNNTQFLVGSISKSFTATLVVKLLHERFPDMGEAVLDTPIRKLLPQVNFTLNDRFRSEQVNFRDLLAHRLCLFRDDLQLMADPFDRADEITYRTRYNPEICGFRSEFQYNNQMYVMASELAGALANKPYEDAIQDLLNELGMESSAFVQRDDDYDQLPLRAKPYYVMDNETLPGDTDLIQRVKLNNAAGGLFTTPDDMSKYMRFHLNLGEVDGRQIVPREVMEWVSKPAQNLPLGAFKNSDEDLLVNEFGYGLGLMLAAYDGWRYIEHAGYFPPYTSFMSLYPTKNLGIFTGTNMAPDMANPMALHAFIFETLRGTDNSTATDKAMKVHEELRRKDEASKIKARSGFQTFYNKQVEKASTKTVADFVGQYGSGSSGELEVSKKFNEESNSTQYYLAYGRYYTGWLQDVSEEGVIFKINFDTNVIQDDYADGNRDTTGYVTFDNDTLIIFSSAPRNGEAILGTFKLGQRLDLLPPVPWNPESCGPE